jgi:hypothetical protein
MRWQYRRQKAVRNGRKRTAQEWLSENQDIAKRLQSEAAAHVSWKSLWLGIEDETGVDIPKDVKWWLQKYAEP